MITGALYDNIGNYDAGFYFAGTMIFLSGAMLFAIPAIQEKIKNKKPSFKIHSGGKDDDDLLTEPWIFWGKIVIFSDLMLKV